MPSRPVWNGCCEYTGIVMCKHRDIVSYRRRIVLNIFRAPSLLFVYASYDDIARTLHRLILPPACQCAQTRCCAIKRHEGNELCLIIQHPHLPTRFFFNSRKARLQLLHRHQRQRKDYSNLLFIGSTYHHVALELVSCCGDICSGCRCAYCYYLSGMERG